MKKMLIFILFFLVLMPMQAAARQWKVDSVHTNFYFEVRHTYAAVRGQFTDFTGEVFFDPDNLEKSKIDFTIMIDSVDTKVGKRDTHLRSPDFFDAARYPVMSFKTTKITHGEKNKYIVEGVLTIKNISKDVALEFTYHGQKENPLNKGEIVAGLDTRLTIDRLEYNVGDGRFYNMGVVDKDVDILFTMELLGGK